MQYSKATNAGPFLFFLSQIFHFFTFYSLNFLTIFLKKLLKFSRLSRTCQIVFKKKIQVKFIFFNFILFSKT
jgi:hypothetical protein